MKRIAKIVIGLLVYLALPIVGETIAPTIPDPLPVVTENSKPITDPIPMITSKPVLVTETPNLEPDPEPRYYITPEERTEIEQAVMAEAGGEPYEGKAAVAQCILNAAELEGIRPIEVLIKYRYTKRRIEPSEDVKMAVAEVFDKGKELIDTSVLYFYAPAVVKSAWHESQEFAIQIGGHKFFRPKEASK